MASVCVLIDSQIAKGFFMPNVKDLSGLRFGRLTVLKLIGRVPARSGHLRTIWLCACDCGAMHESIAHDLARGATLSCGCLARELSSKRLLKHGHARHVNSSSEYKSWRGMKNRCYNEADEHYANYGARGIFVCDRWKDSFENFLSDMGKRPAGCTIGRIDNDGPYEPSNCLWETATEQANNRRSSVWQEWNGRKMTLSQIATEEGISYHSLHQAFRRRTDVALADIVAAIRANDGHKGRYQIAARP